jgi:DDE superfamily endonuclease
VTTGPARAQLRRLGLFLDGFSACFSRQPQREAATQYIDGLFNDSERKSMQAMPGRLGDPRDYQALQHFITHSPWQAARGTLASAAGSASAGPSGCSGCGAHRYRADGWGHAVHAAGIACEAHMDSGEGITLPPYSLNS